MNDWRGYGTGGTGSDGGVGFGPLKKIQDFPSHQIFEHMHEALNLILKNN